MQNAAILISSYAQPTGDTTGYHSVICFLYNEGIANIVEQIYQGALKQDGEIKC